MVGSLPVIASGLRWGRFRPLVAALLLAVAGTAALHLSGHAGVFAGANIVTSIVWAFCIPYLLGLCASFDRSGRTATLASFSSELGLASGPMAGGLLVTAGDWGLLINVACGALVLSALFALIPARHLDRQGDLAPRASGSMHG
jgi:predicted MFS family arabinose efflux permease